MDNLGRRISNLVVLPHSVFALPFALASLTLAIRMGPTGGAAGKNYAWTFILVVLAIVLARTSAMAFNRVIDAEIDARNPRTRNREIPSGVVSRSQAWAVTVASASGFLLVAALLGLDCLLLAPAVLVVLLGYSFTKRFTPYSHLVLGLALALAPGGAWWVMRPSIEPLPLVLMAGVILWVSGFDILYSCQDALFDRRQGIFSVPAQFGTDTALKIAFGLHLTSSALFFSVGRFAGLGTVYYLGVFVLSAVLLMQHRTVSPLDFSKINRSFFTFNGAVSVGYFLVVLASCV